MSHVQIARRNARLVLASTFANSLWFTLPIWYLYSTNQLHLSAATAINLNILIWFISILFNAPTGAIADRHSRKYTYLCGILLASLMPLAFALHQPLYILVISTIIAGIGQAVMSGALLPLVHRHYEKAGMLGTKYSLFLSSYQSIFYVGRIITGIIGAWLYTVNPVLPFIATLAAFAVNFVIVCFVNDVSPEDQTNMTWRHIVATIRTLWHTPIIKQLILLYIAIDISGEAIWTAYQALYIADGRSATTIGWLFTAIAAMSAVGSYVYRHVITRRSVFFIFQIAALAVCTTAYLLWQNNHTLRLLAVVPSGFIFGTTVIALNDVTQHRLANRYHSTALSLLATLKVAIFIAGSFLIGQVIERYHTDTARNVLFVTTIILTAGSLLFMRNSAKRSE